MAGKPGRSGAPAGNTNSLKNGSRIGKQRLVIGDLPKELLSARREARAYRRLLESATEADRGEINLNDAHKIDLASGATVAAAIARWLLKNKLDDMSVSDILAATRQIVSSKETRNKAVDSLGLERDKSQDIFDALYGQKDVSPNGHADGAGGIEPGK